MRAARLTAVLLAGLTATGCGAGLYDVDLPGGADLGDHPYQVTVHFRDVLDLVPQSAVKVEDVPVGRVEAITLSADGRTAVVSLSVNGEIRLAANAYARLRQSSVLGEKFVELDDPDDDARIGTLADGAVIPVERTNRNPEIEEVFGALSLLLNGGGIGQLQLITQELNNALEGRESDIKSLLKNLDTFAGQLDSHRAEIVRAIEGMDRLAADLGPRGDQITALLEGLGPGIEVLASQREQFVTMLKSLDRLSGVAVDVVERSKDDLVADLRALEPTLRELTKAGQQLPQAMEVLFTFPFTDKAMAAVRGDYINSYLSFSAQSPVPGAAALPLPPVDGGEG
ncbi:MCE family protein [Actinokineospora sp. UTMC 2448]|uniref:MCE family protein n=1 Tax=Actinokineospora sp. UTMC 2448 TaxID=2268449 RepID=UPI002164522F|nr:MCE family protein [Actinokineospora sp. UTMC 2448]UVS78917.1 virulence factor Mce family protein [Actinokineospora sp. UTMC 2448]